MKRARETWKAQLAKAWETHHVSIEGEWRDTLDDGVCEWESKSATLSLKHLLDFVGAEKQLQHVGLRMDGKTIRVRASRRVEDWTYGGAPHLQLALMTRKSVVKMSELLNDSDRPQDMPLADWARIKDVVHLFSIVQGLDAPLRLEVQVAPPRPGPTYQLTIKGFVDLDLEHLLTVLRLFNHLIVDMNLSPEAVTVHVATDPTKVLHVWAASGVHRVAREEMVVPPAAKRRRRAGEDGDAEMLTVSMTT